MTDQQKLQALVHLSSWRQVPAVDELTSMICQSPDPETARRAVLSQIDSTSDVICQKWAQTVDDLWFAEHPAWPLLLHLPLATADVAAVAAVDDAQAFLAALAQRPAELVVEGRELLLASGEVARLARCLSGRALPVAVEQEWAYLPVRRLRAVLQALRLARVHRGQLVINQCRYQRWLDFPRLQQFYILWHADTHHVDWSAFAGPAWGPFLRGIQDYLQVLWDISYHQRDHWQPDRWSREIVNAFAWLWEQQQPLYVYEHYALPQIVEQLIVRDLFVRYGLASSAEPDASWTRVGREIIAAELHASLPCGMTLLE